MRPAHVRLELLSGVMESQEDELLAAPVDFRRMLSWQLSMPSGPPTAKRKQRKKTRYEAQKSSTFDDLSLLEDESQESVDFTLCGDEEIAECAYIYVNSDGEEDVYYSAPESPLISEDDTPIDQPDSSVAVNPLPLQPQVWENRKKKSRRSKKRARYLARAAKTEFFQPLCELVEDRLHVDVGELKISSRAQVLSLTEICIRKIRADSLGGLHVHIDNLHIDV